MDELWQMLYDRAMAAIAPRRISDAISCGEVAASVLTKSGKVYTGVCIDTNCSLGVCAERNALGTMISDGECEVSRVLAVYMDGGVMPPCGACREFMMQLPGGRDIEVLLSNDGSTKTVAELVPDYY